MPRPLPGLRRRVLLLVAGWAAVIAALPRIAVAADDAQRDYEIKLTRPETVGLRYTMTAEGALLRRTTLIVGGQSRRQPEEGLGVKLEGTVEVLAVNDKGRATKIACDVSRCVLVTSGEGEKELIPAGKTIIAEGAADETTFKLKDGQGELPPGAAAALDLVISLENDPDDSTDDEVFGTAQRQKVGGEWPMDAERMARDAQNEGVKVKKESVSGAVKLAAVEAVDGAECLKLTGRVDAGDVEPPAPQEVGLPETLKPAGGSIRYRFVVLLPTDVSAGALSESISIRHETAHTGAVGGGGSDVRVETRIQRATQMTRKFLTEK